MQKVLQVWASPMRQAGVGLDDLQGLGGWESRITVKRYAHVNLDHLKPLAGGLDNALRPNNGARIGQIVVAG